jgi:hypothetical protein
MARSTTAKIKQALVAKMRGDTPIKTAAKGGFHQGFAPLNTKYPFVAHSLVTAPSSRTWGGSSKDLVIQAVYDIEVWGTDSVEAENLDMLIAELFDEQTLSVDGQSTLIVRRVADLESEDIGEEGQKVYQVGGTYIVWTDQSVG